MKLATLRDGSRDGALIVVSADLTCWRSVSEVAPTLQAALDDWIDVSAELASVHRLLNEGHYRDARPFRAEDMAAPLPRAYQFLDGSAYLNHVELVRRARGAEMPPEFLSDPLMYQGCSDSLLGPTDPIVAASEDWGIDFESEVAVITGDVAMGATPDEAAHCIRLVMLLNDVSLRNLIPAELSKGFGFLNGKPASACSPVAATPDSLGEAWRDGKLHLPLSTWLNGERFGNPEAGDDMNFDFPTLIAHAARTRRLTAGTVIGSGTVSNRDRSRGSSCLVERRTIETLDEGRPRTPYLRFGDQVRIDMVDGTGQSIFGAINQEVAAVGNPAAGPDDARGANKAIC